MQKMSSNPNKRPLFSRQRRPSQLLAALAMLLLAAACGGEADEQQAGVGGAGGDAGGAAAGGDSSSGAGASSGSDSGGADSSGNGANTAASSGGSTGTMGDTCSIMSSNKQCAGCLEQKCCDVLNACQDADLFSCISCLDCFLEGDGPECCEQAPDVHKNLWLVECVAFNCEAECS